MRNRKRTLTVVLAVLIGFLLLFSDLFITVEADHECVSDDCTICQVLNSCEEIRENLIIVTAVAAAVVALCFAIVAAIQFNSKVYAALTPVSLKTKISD